MMKIQSYLKIILITLFFASDVSQAAVVMNASRIIMDGTPEKTVTFDNTSDSPFIVQVEPDSNGEPDFVAIPPVFKIKGKGGQTVKVKLLHTDLPRDRESLFYLNFTQIPSAKKNESGDSRLNIFIRSRLKVIYRPESVKAFSEEKAGSVSYYFQKGKLVVSNHSQNVISIQNVSEGENILAQQFTLLPGDSYSTVVKDTHVSGPLHASMINDYGIPVSFLIKQD
ncbi:fimbrial biogenesis chaperone [Pantoea ananatis]|uniref:fimbrial biogenesis chaperone n=1 Tax=Pantoea ananas TaxID=553 RepID=UPI001F0BAB71|nr:molecular chaperone [Pantoea ananatis]